MVKINDGSSRPIIEQPNVDLEGLESPAPQIDIETTSPSEVSLDMSKTVIRPEAMSLPGANLEAKAQVSNQDQLRVESQPQDQPRRQEETRTNKHESTSRPKDEKPLKRSTIFGNMERIRENNYVNQTRKNSAPEPVQQDAQPSGPSDFVQEGNIFAENTQNMPQEKKALVYLG